MKLMQWLAVGRSWGRARDERNRYKLPEQALLPRFGPVEKAVGEWRRSTSSGGSTAANGTAVTTSGNTAAKERNAMRTVELDAGEPASTDKNAAMDISASAGGPGSSNPSVSTPPPSPSVAEHKFPLGRWTVFRNPFGKAPKAGLPGRTPVQGELLLELVKPVRNDLADSDLVVVAGTAAPPDKAEKVEPATVTPAAARAEREPIRQAQGRLAEPVWSRLKTQFFGAANE